MCITSSIGLKFELSTPQQQRCEKRRLRGLPVAENTPGQWRKERQAKHRLQHPLVQRIESAVLPTFHHGTTIGVDGNFHHARPGQVFKASSDFFVVAPTEDRVAAAFARRFSKGTPVVLTVCPVDPKAAMNPPNFHGHISFPENTELLIKSVRTVTGQEEGLRAGDFSTHSSLNGWL